MEDNEIRTYVTGEFGRDGLQIAAQIVVGDTRLPESSKQYLIEVGLPREPILELSFSLGDVKLPTLASIAPSISMFPEGRIIGEGTDCVVCLDESTNGAVVLIDLTGVTPTCFMNSRVEFFGTCLAMYHEYCRRGPTMSEQQVDEYIRDMEARIKNLDWEAMRDPNFFWSVIVEQMHDGLL